MDEISDPGFVRAPPPAYPGGPPMQPMPSHPQMMAPQHLYAPEGAQMQPMPPPPSVPQMIPNGQPTSSDWFDFNLGNGGVSIFIHVSKYSRHSECFEDHNFATLAFFSSIWIAMRREIWYKSC